jgi:hypothetical protein
MPMILPRSVFLMLPRTATTWARQAIRNGGISYRETNPKHAPEVLPQNPPLAGVPTFRFTFTREPRAWLRSRWTLGKWDDDLSPYWNIDRDKFLTAVNDSMIEMYFAKYTRHCQFVGTCENIADDLVKALRQAGEDFDETALRDTPRINDSPAHGDLYGSALWAMKRDELGNLPPDMMSRLPVDLLPKLPQDSLGKLPPNVLAEMVKRTTQSALESAGAAPRK